LFMIKRVTIFCGSSTGNDHAFLDDCIHLAGFLHKKKIGMVYGGGNIGLMGVLADELLRLGGEVTGVIPKKLADIELAHHGLTRLHIVKTMHERKALMANLSDAFMVLPGGIGTMDEFFEIFTWLQLGYHNKPIGISNINGFYDVLLGLLDNMVQKQFIHEPYFDRLVIQRNAVDTMNKMLHLGEVNKNCLS
jgi:uncharacterized protein (TIGR00730 family)